MSDIITPGCSFNRRRFQPQNREKENFEKEVG